MIIPFLENSFKHGLSNVITHGYVKIIVKIKGTELEFFIENSKPERLSLPENRRVGGIGLVNVLTQISPSVSGSASTAHKRNPEILCR
jgi:two-component system LytT family sensor kinase